MEKKSSKILNYIKASPNAVLTEIVEAAQVSKAGELWDKMKSLDTESRNRILRVVEALID